MGVMWVMSNNKLLMLKSICFLFAFFVLFTFQVYASESSVIKGCSGEPVEITIKSASSDINNKEFRFECSDNCGVITQHVGGGLQITPGFIGYTRTYKLKFYSAGTHNVSVYVDGVLDENLNTIVIISEEHLYGDPEIKEPTCTTSGFKKYVCSICGHFYEVYSVPLEHNYVETIEKKQTCTESGQVSYVCSYCEHSYSRELKAEGHSYEKLSEFLPTCTKPGEKILVCSKCHDTYKQSWPAKGHSFSKWSIIKESTIFNNGSKTRICSVCNQKDIKITRKLKANVSLSKTTLNLKPGKVYKLKIKNKTRGDKIKKWSSSKSKVVFINNKNGKIKALRNGMAVITLKMKSGCTAKCTVYVGVKKNKSGNRNPNQSDIVS